MNFRRRKCRFTMPFKSAAHQWLSCCSKPGTLPAPPRGDEAKVPNRFPLHMAISRDRVDIVQLLLCYKADFGHRRYILADTPAFRGSIWQGKNR